MDSFKLSKLEYIRPDFDEFRSTLEAGIEKVIIATCYEEVKSIMQEVEERGKEVETMCVIASIRNTLDTTDEYYEKENEYNNVTVPTIMEANMKFNKALLASPYVKDLENEYGKQLLVGMQREIDSFNPELVPYMQRESILTNQYQKLMATAKIDFDGQTLNLYGIQKYFG